MLRTIAAIAAALPLLAHAALGLPAVDPPSDPPAERVTAELTTVYGSGCPAGTVGSSVVPGNAGMTLDYGAFRAEVGPDAAVADRRKTCQLGLAIQAPQGYTYAVSGVEYSGDAYLPEGATAHLRTRFTFAGDPVPDLTTFSLAGPFNDLWRHDEPVEPLGWASCTQPRLLNLVTELRILPGELDPEVSEAFVSLDWLAAPAVVYRLAWRRC